MSLRSPYRRLLDLVKTPPVDIAQVTGVEGALRRVTYVGGGTAVVKGTAGVGAKVFVRGDVIEGAAPSLPMSTLEVQ